ncbi:MAG: bacterial Ig-like domain-containing protein [Streptococcaceae bacterium]|nr:bacterial Ig-like domain-containing protein [Streptococcaceae bacterium]
MITKNHNKNKHLAKKDNFRSWKSGKKWLYAAGTTFVVAAGVAVAQNAGADALLVQNLSSAASTAITAPSNISSASSATSSSSASSVPLSVTSFVTSQNSVVNSSSTAVQTAATSSATVVSPTSQAVSNNTVQSSYYQSLLTSTVSGVTAISLADTTAINSASITLANAGFLDSTLSDAISAAVSMVGLSGAAMALNAAATVFPPAAAGAVALTTLNNIGAVIDQAKIAVSNADVTLSQAIITAENIANGVLSTVGLSSLMPTITIPTVSQLLVGSYPTVTYTSLATVTVPNVMTDPIGAASATAQNVLSTTYNTAMATLSGAVSAAGNATLSAVASTISNVSTSLNQAGIVGLNVATLLDPATNTTNYVTNAVIDTVVNAVADAANVAVQGLIGGASSYISSTFGSSVGSLAVPALSAIADFANTNLSNILAASPNSVLASVNQLGSVLLSAASGLVGAAQPVLNSILTTAQDAVNTVMTAISGVANNIGQAVSGVANSVFGALSTAWNGLVSTVQNVIQNVINGIQAITSGTQSSVASSAVDSSAIVANDVTVAQGASWAPSAGFVSATDSKGNPLAVNQIVVYGAVDTSKAGQYQVTYQYTDSTTYKTTTVKKTVTVAAASASAVTATTMTLATPTTLGVMSTVSGSSVALASISAPSIALATATDPLTAITDALNSVTSTLTGAVTSGVSSLTSDAAATLSTAVTGLLSSAAAVISGIPATLGTALGGALSGITSMTTGLTSSLGSIASTAVAIPTDLVNTLGSMVSGAATAVSSAVAGLASGFNPATIVSDAVAAVNSAFSPIASAATSLVSSAVVGVTSLVSEATSALSTGVNSLLSSVSTLVSGVPSALSSALASVSSMASGLTSALGSIASAAMTVPTNLANSLAALASNAASAVTSAVSGLTSGVDPIAMLSNAIVAVNSVFTPIASTASSLVSTAIAGVSSLASNAASALSTGVTDLLSNASSLVSGIPTAINSAVSGVSSMASGVTSALGSVASAAMSLPTDLANSLASFVSNAVTAVGSAVSGLTSGFDPAALLSNTVAAVGSALAPITSMVSSLVSGATSAVSTALAGIQSAISGISSLFPNLGSALGSIGSQIASGVSSAISGITSTVGSAVQLVSDTVNGIINGVGGLVSGADQILNDVMSAVSTAFQDALAVINSLANDIPKIQPVTINAHSSVIPEDSVWNAVDNFNGATDISGDSIPFNSSNITVTGTVDTSKPGVYTITYHNSQDLIFNAQKTITVTVLANKAPQVNTLNTTVPIGYNWQPAFNFTNAVDSEDIAVPFQNITESGFVNTGVPGVYNVIYSYTDPTTGFTGTSTATITVAANILQTTNTTHQVGDVWNPNENFVTGTDYLGQTITAQSVQNTNNVNTAIPGVYTVTYEYSVNVIDNQGGVQSIPTTATAKVTVLDKLVAQDQTFYVGNFDATKAYAEPMAYVSGLGPDANMDGVADPIAYSAVTPVGFDAIPQDANGNFTTAGDYQVSYYYMDPVTGAAASNIATIHVLWQPSNLLAQGGTYYVGQSETTAQNGMFVSGKTSTNVPLTDSDVTAVGFPTADTNGNFTTPGQYQVSYTYQDPNTGLQTSNTVTLTVLADGTLTAQNVNYTIGQPLATAITSAYVSGADANVHPIAEPATTPVGFNAIPVDSNGNFTTPGTYQVYYTTTDPVSGASIASNIVTVTVSYAQPVIKAGTTTIYVTQSLDTALADQQTKITGTDSQLQAIASPWTNFDQTVTNSSFFTTDANGNKVPIAGLTLDSAGTGYDFTTPGTYIVNYSYTDPTSGLVATTTGTIIVLPAQTQAVPVVTAKPDFTVIQDVAWTVGEGLQSVVNAAGQTVPNAAAVETGAPNTAVTGTYTVTYTYIDPTTGAQDADSVVVTVVPAVTSTTETVAVTYQDTTGTALVPTTTVTITGTKGDTVNLPVAPTVAGYTPSTITYNGITVSAGATVALTGADNLVYNYTKTPVVTPPVTGQIIENIKAGTSNGVIVPTSNQTVYDNVTLVGYTGYANTSQTITGKLYANGVLVGTTTATAQFDASGLATTVLTYSFDNTAYSGSAFTSVVTLP